METSNLPTDEDLRFLERVALRKRVPILAIAFEVTVVRVSRQGQQSWWVMDCPICSAEGQLTIVAEDTFQCGSCRASGDLVTLYQIFNYGAEVEDAIHYVRGWVAANPKGPSVPLTAIYNSQYGAG